MSQNPRDGTIDLLVQLASKCLFVVGAIAGLGGIAGLIESIDTGYHADPMLQMIFGVLCWIIIVLERIHHAVCQLIPERPAEPRQPPPPVNRPMQWPQD